jgi:TonB-linked SusC/RagA family outer membrane protein
MQFKALSNQARHALPSERRPKSWCLTKTLLVMKLTSFFMLAACLQVSARVHSQTVSYSAREVPLEQVFPVIKAQTGYVVFCNANILTGIKPVTITAKNLDLEDFLKELLNGLPLEYSIKKKTIIISAAAVAVNTNNEDSPPPTDIHGHITDSLGNPLAGASITVKGTHHIATTDANGEFTMKDINANAVIVVSYIGYSTSEIALKGKKEISLSLRIASAQLGDVEVVYSTGYQTIPKERAVGSFDVLDNATLNINTGTNILNRLDGVASGVVFVKQNIANAPANGFQIRGFSTINGPTDPLIVVDNFPYDGDINNINPADVESITVLKDASAASIWGVRAGNGVVVITTKKGRFNQPLKIEFNADVMTTGKPDLMALRTISSSDYINVESMLFGQGFYDPYLNDTYFYSPVSPAVGIMAAARSGSISPADSASQIDALKKNDSRQQYAQYMYQRAVTEQYSLNLRGGSGNVAYYLSGGYDKGIDQLHNLNNRLVFRSGNSYAPVKGLQVNVNLEYTSISTTSGRPAYGSIRTGGWLIPYNQFANAKGNPLPVAGYYNTGYTDTAGGGQLLNYNYYPLTDWEHSQTKTSQQDLVADLSVNYNFLKHFGVGVNYRYERQTVGSNNLQDTGSYFTRALINQFTQLIPGQPPTYIVPLGDILNTSTSLSESQDIRGQLNFSEHWGNNDVVAFGGGEVRQLTTSGSGYTEYGYDPNTAFNTSVDLANAYPSSVNGFYNIIPGGIAAGTGGLNRFVSYYGNGAYTYKGRYILTLSGRRDASNLFGVATNNKWNPFWSAGAGWVLSKELFYKSRLLPYLRFKFTYGLSGNTDPARSAVTTLALGNPGYPNFLPVARVTQFPNPDLKWETVRMINFGVDFGFINQAVTGTFEGYIKQGYNEYGPALVDPTAGLDDANTVTKNVANMQGHGFDLTINSKNTQGAFKWTTTLLFSYNNSKITRYFVDTGSYTGIFLSQGVSNVDPIVGKPMYAIVALKWGGLDAQGNPQEYLNGKLSEDYSTIGQLTPKNQFVVKPSLPTVYGSFTNSFGYHGFLLTAVIGYRLGYYFYKPSIDYNTLFGTGAYIGSSDFAKRWQAPGDEKRTNVPAMIYPDNDPYRGQDYDYSTANVDNASAIRLQEVNLGYSFTHLFGKKAPFNGVQIYCKVSNLGIIWKANKDGIDPDFLANIPPPAKTWTLGISTNL